ncbi:MAG TPA: hypothetical protein VD994_02675, partial [Prosthecobacter sp.]|nr:hypothetical protein [Prosthecobacter sp.]
GDGTAAAPVKLQGWRTPWKTTASPGSPAQPATALAGIYTAALDLADEALKEQEAYPQGYGSGTLKITTAGAATWTGTLADGTAVTRGTAVGPGGEVPLHFMLYTPTAAATAGSAHGWVRVSPGADAGKLEDNTLDTMLDLTEAQPQDQPMFDWRKQPQLPAAVTRSYKAGIPLHKLKVTGGGYVKPATGMLVLNLPDEAENAKLTFSGANVETSLTYLNSNRGGPGASMDKKVIRITKTNTLAPFAAGTNPATITLKINAATGALSGSFKLVADPDLTDHVAPIATVDRKVNFAGFLVPRLNTGVGSFQLPQMPTEGPPTTPTTTAPILSGRVILEPSH